MSNKLSVNRLRILILHLLLFASSSGMILSAEDGYRLWLRYEKINDPDLLKIYRQTVSYTIFNFDKDPVIRAAYKEFQAGIGGLLGSEPESRREISGKGAVIAGIPDSNPYLSKQGYRDRAERLGDEGYQIFTDIVEGEECIIILANKPVGVLYGVFHFLRLLQTRSGLRALDIRELPKIDHRLLNHWDNLDRTVERGYAGFSIWNWHTLPDYLDRRYTDYARANASIGINGTVLTNVNANALVLTPSYLEKVAALADLFRPYGIKVYLTARFNAPVELRELTTADPLDPEVIAWWKRKAEEIYRLIPDFGGFLVKANSEGQPGPQNYNRSHADGANMLAGAVAEYGGIVMWRAFVYDDKVPEDRAKQAYNEFVPLDGKFRENVFIQVKNGAIDFQPREPFHPMFGAMPATPLAMEFQVTQEYLGQGTTLAFLAPLFKECLDSDTYARGAGSTVSKVIDGSLFGHTESAIAGVSNTGNDINWTGHHFAQANWYAYGRLAWNHELSPGEIAGEWLRMTFTNDEDFVSEVSEVMLASREIVVNYMTPLGLHHIMGAGHHYGPGPWVSRGRPDWTSVYYHRADSAGIGFDRSTGGSDAVSQYYDKVAENFGNLETCPEKYLLWFHHVNWDHSLKSGRTLWDEICYRYYAGVDSVRWMQKIWAEQKGKIDRERYDAVTSFLKIQYDEASWWRDACILYFQTFSGRPVPEGLEPPDVTLEALMKLQFPYAPGIRPRW